MANPAKIKSRIPNRIFFIDPAKIEESFLIAKPQSKQYGLFLNVYALYFCMVNIALIGYGKMGMEIEKIAIERGHDIVQKFNSQYPLKAELLENVDVAIEFSRPELAVKHIETCLHVHCPIVIGTTGWYDSFDQLSADCSEYAGSMLHATNFSIGVNIAFQVNEILAKIMSHYPQYAAGITEIHHTRKLDAPSGTAITLAEGIINNHHSFQSWQLGTGEAVGPILPIETLREGDVPGTHIVTFSGPIDSITLQHEAHNRTGFALGAVMAAEWLSDKKGVYSMKDMLNFDALIKQ